MPSCSRPLVQYEVNTSLCGPSESSGAEVSLRVVGVVWSWTSDVTLGRRGLSMHDRLRQSIVVFHNVLSIERLHLKVAE